MNLEDKVNTLMKINNRDYLARSNILETIKRGVRKRDITTEKQLKELALIYKVTGRELLISGHKKGGDYYTAYLDGKFKPHHIKFMETKPFIVSQLYDTTLKGRLPARAIIPLYKLPETATTYLSKFDKYATSKSPIAYNIRLFIIGVLRHVIKNGNIYHMRSKILERINGLRNSNLRNNLSEFYEWHETVRNANS
tara:strand:+ start:226 stop:813 length:588 start_codon:yes stop_codon:yes gene_type:complete